MRKWWKEVEVTAFNPPGSNLNLLPYLPPPVWTTEDFEGIIWRDEFSVAMNPTGSDLGFLNTVGGMVKDFIVPRMGKEAALMEWGWFWGRNRSPLVPLPQKSITSHIYRRMLHENLLPTLRQIDVTLGDPVFQQDNARIYPRI